MPPQNPKQQTVAAIRHGLAVHSFALMALECCVDTDDWSQARNISGDLKAMIVALDEVLEYLILNGFDSDKP